jgi:lipid A 3-O-deacylase
MQAQGQPAADKSRHFADHLAVGRRFGEGLQPEVALRVQHFSSGGIHRPNPGEDFLQLRYWRRL